MKKMEHNSGCLTTTLNPIGGIEVGLQKVGGMTISLFPVCSTNLQPTDIPRNALCDCNGIPFITADGYYLIVNAA